MISKKKKKIIMEETPSSSSEAETQPVVELGCGPLCSCACQARANQDICFRESRKSSVEAVGPGAWAGLVCPPETLWEAYWDVSQTCKKVAGESATRICWKEGWPVRCW